MNTKITALEQRLDKLPYYKPLKILRLVREIRKERSKQNE